MADSNIMLALGDYRFSISTAAYTELQRQTSYRWQAVERIGLKPVQQYLGPGEDNITLNGTIYPYYKGGLGQVSQMRVEASKGTPLLMVDGAGRIWGNFCIKEVSETHGTFFSDGTPRKIDFTITMVADGDDTPGAIS